jgi:hypothetical protein
VIDVCDRQHNGPIYDTEAGERTPLLPVLVEGIHRERMFLAHDARRYELN